MAGGDSGRGGTIVASRRDGITLAGLLRERRISAGLTQRNLAAASGVSIGALRDLEQGRTRCPRWPTMAAMAAILGLDRHDLVALADAWAYEHPGAGAWHDGGENQAVQIGVLGPLTAQRDGIAVELISPRLRALLGLLALHGTTGVARDVIVDTLWGERPPRSAVAEVHGYVSRLRRLLDPGRTPRGKDGLVVLVGRWYRIGAGIGVDLARFRDLSRRADAAAAIGDVRLACALYERSLGLWRGEAVADVDLLQGHPAVAETARLRGEVALRFARAAAAAGAHDRVLPHMQALCVREPFNEDAHAHLIAALAATGRQAEALQIFSDLRRRLDAELGIRPGAQLAAAHLRILRQQAGCQPVRPGARAPRS